MRKKIVIESNIETAKFSLYDENDMRIIGEDVTIAEAAKELKCSEELLKLLANNHNFLVETIHLDLVDLYNKLD